MKVIEEYQQIDSNRERSVALGNFDGIHIGHQKLIEHLLDKSEPEKLESCVYTFINHTIPVIADQQPIQYITNLNSRKEIFQGLGVDMLFLDSFDKEMMTLTPEAFVEKILVKVLNCKIAVVGFDYRFGYKAQGDVELLKKLGEKYGFQVSVVDAVTINEEKVSSSNIKKYLKNGDVEKANAFLGRFFSIRNKVIHGDARGKKLGYPTANIDVDPLQLTPKEGVYATLININNNTYMGATFIGTKPTFKSEKIAIETFIIDYEGDLYHQFIDISFIKRIREEIIFKSPNELIKQINEDIKHIKTYLHSNTNVLK
ncbi:FMN adenylyltransferase [Natronincola peptidivorans]|uniref:Riboflavin biosynthesis protein n=1 Tax=Natronincola peptidivorans TaxID=426128 RepID=A0A1H9YI14_9FIRM|nr:bifunctional riboflavin kinase/FAD synthetase [Natronincola peptidivorans]SES68598.1 FMN adenylyltransferase [Natronincola peptidivorans]